MSMEAINALHQRIKDLAASSTPDQLAYLAKALESIIDKKATFSVEQMTEVKEVIDAIQKRLKDLAVSSTPDQLAYLAKALESIVDKSSVSEIVQMTDGKLKELLSAARLHLNEINSNKENSISAITTAKTESVNEINTLKTNTLDTLKASSDSYVSLLDTRKNANIAAINSVSNTHKDGLKGLVEDFRAVNDVPDGSSIMKEIKTRDEQLKTSLTNEVKTWDNQLKTSIVSEVKTRDDQLKNTFEIISDPEILLNTINNNNLETWLNNTENRRKFSKMLSNANAVLNITGHTSALSKLIRSPKAIQELIKSSVALNIVAHTTAIDVLASSEEMMKTIIASASAITIMAASSIAVRAMVSNGKILHMIIKSEAACKAIEANIQNYRSTVVSVVDAFPSLFRREYSITVGNGTDTRESGRGSATIYLPVGCYDDNDTDFSVNSLLTGNKIIYIARHSGTTTVSSGVALRGVQVSGTGSSVGNVVFNICTAK
ncbi:MAG: hypothetical protein LKM43_00180 [Wolbachia endosymbiont of Penenirmus auritus]|nr:hypothetical protein [Wolbachia endosymbiont of Penenirmus auritus]